MAVTMLGIFSTRQEAEDAISELQDKGYNVKNMSIIMRNGEDRDRLSENTGANVGGGIATGAATGAVLGGLTGLLVGIGLITIPGLGVLLIGGPLAGALGLTGAAAATAEGLVTGAVAGGIVGGLVDLGMPEERARVYEERVRNGGILLAVPSMNGDRATIQDILSAHGATDIQSLALPSLREGKYATDTARDGKDVREDEEYREGYRHSRTHDHVDMDNVQKFLRHVDYPATKSDLLEIAEEEGADKEVMQTLEDLPNKKFETPHQVDRALTRHH